MSQLEVDKIIPQSGTTLTIGDSGDTISFADGATLAIDTNTLAIDSTNNRVGIGTSSPQTVLHVDNESPIRIDRSTPNSTNDFIQLYDEDQAAVAAMLRLGQSGEFILNAGGSSDTLRLDTNGVERMRIDTSGNVGIGKVPNASFGSYDALEIGNAGFLTSIGSGNENIFVGSNAYLNGSGSWTYMTTNEATYYRQGDGRHSWHYASSGTADTAISFSEAMRIDGNGNVFINKTADSVASDGFQFLGGSGNYLAVTRDGGVTAYFNRRTSDGSIVEFRKDNSAVGSIGSAFSSTYYAGSNSGIRFASNALPTNGSGANSDNAVDLGISSVRWKDFYLGGNIYLGGTTSANALDDYEEGTWTPTLALVSVTYTSQSGTYTKIGNQVFITADITTATLDNTDNSDFTISGIPFYNDGKSCVATIDKETSTIFTNPSIVDSFRIGLSTQFRAFQADGTSFDYNDGTTSGRLLVKIQYSTTD